MMERYAAVAFAALMMLCYIGAQQYSADDGVALMRRRLDDEHPAGAVNPGLSSMQQEKHALNQNPDGNLERDLKDQEEEVRTTEEVVEAAEEISVETRYEVVAEVAVSEIHREEAREGGGAVPLIQYHEDGTLLVHQMPETAACSYFVNLPNLPMRVGETPKRIHYHIEDCSDDHLGVELAEHFGHYLLANAAQVPYTMTCGNGDAGGDSVLKTLQTNNEFPGPPPVDVAGHQYSPYDVCFACYGLSFWCDRGPELMVQTFQQEMWKLANSKIGQSLEVEDAVVHLKLGNALESGRDEGAGLLPFRSYSRLLRRVENEEGPLKTISVVTQTFDEGASRKEDKKSLKRSALVAKEFLAHLREEFPNAVVKLHNSPADTPLVTYVRLIKAKKAAICGAATFCTYPVLANLGISHVFESDTLNPWTKRLRYIETVRSYANPRLASNYAGSLADNQLLHWLRHQNPNGNDSITSPPLFRVPKTKFSYQ